jgi:hypothetical protein
MFSNQLVGWDDLMRTEGKNELLHFDSRSCWCDPIVEVDEDGHHVVIHREVTWN